MAITQINVGAVPDDGTGDPLRVAFQKINLNTENLVAQIATKADDAATTAALAQKANLEEMTTALAGKADAQTTEQALAQKANTADVQEALDLKANTADVDAALALKANALDVQNALAQMPGEAPDDGDQYARQNKAWVKVQTGGGSGTTNLGVANRTADTLDITSSTGTPATLPSADEAQAGLMSAAQVQRLGGVGLQTVSVFDADPQNTTPVAQLRGGSMATYDEGGLRWPHGTYNVDLIAPQDPAVVGDIEVSMPDETGTMATREWVAANAVRKTSASGVALLPEGDNAQRPAAGDIPTGAALARGNTQSGTDYFLEFRNRVSNAWEAFASRTWVQALVDRWLGFTIIYPNGGSAATPANITLGSTYVENNPFPGFYVDCRCQVFAEGKWVTAPFQNYIVGGVGNSVGASADQDVIADMIRVMAGGVFIVVGSNAQSYASPRPTANFTTAPCRVLVSKKAKFP